MRRPRRLPQGPVINLQMRFWLIVLVVLIVALWLLSEILLPFVFGLAIAYLLTPTVDRLQRMGVPRLAGSCS